jgi:Protein of unknown function (DUF3800)
VQLVYLDEAGVGNAAHEPHLIVAGVIIDADRKWKQIENYFRELVSEVFGEDDLRGHIFHAKDVWHGSGIFDRQKWPRQKRIQLLRRLAQVPRLFELPIPVSITDRAEFRTNLLKRSPSIPEKNVDLLAHANSFIGAAQIIDYWMEKNAPDEIAMLIAEDRQEVKEAIKLFHDGYTDPTFTNYEENDAFASQHIVEGVHFAKKTESLFLQIADHCAFICRRYQAGKEDIKELFELIAPQLRQEHIKRTRLPVRIAIKNLQRISE